MRLSSRGRRSFTTISTTLLDPPARKAQLFGAALFPDLFGLPKQFDPKAYAGKRSDYTTDFPDEFGKTVDMMHPVPRATLLAQQRRPDGRTFVARALNGISGGEDHLYIRKIAEEARAHGTQLIFIYIPIFNGPATISDRAFLEQYGQVLNLGDLAQRDELFENWGHFNHAGAMTASARLCGMRSPASTSEAPFGNAASMAAFFHSGRSRRLTPADFAPWLRR